MHKHVQVVVAVLLLAWVAGCSSEPKDPFASWDAANKYRDFVPPTAEVVAKGTGTLTFTAPSDGTLHLLDTTQMVQVKDVMKPKVIAGGWIPKGTEITFDPNAKRIHAKGRSGVGLTQIDPTHAHELRFEPTPKPK